MKSTFIAFFLFGTITAFSQVVINEYSASNLNSFQDKFSRTEDWIELYNTSSTAMDISGYHLSDKESKLKKWVIPEGTIIPGNGHLHFWCSGRDLVSGDEYHTNFKLAQTTKKDIVMFTDPDGTIINRFDMELTLVEHSRCRAVDGGDDWVVCTNPTPGTSNNGTPQFAAYTSTPSMSQAAGFYDGPITVEITNNQPNSVLRYTLDGSNPTSNSMLYTQPIELTQTTVVKATAFSDDPAMLTGKMDFNTYFINEEEISLAVFSVAADDVQQLAGGQGNLIPIGSLEYFNVDKEREAVGFGSLNRHGQDSWVLDHRSLDWVTRDEMGYTKSIEAPLFSYSDRDEYQKFMFRNSGDDNYPAINDFAHQGSTHIRDEYVQTLALEGGMSLDTRAVERVALYLDGIFWGIYGMRERPVDHDYTNEYYDQDKYNVHYLSTWGTTEAEYGGQAAFNDWYEIRDFVLENDMGVAENYDYVKERINLLSFSDYFIMNLFVVAKDWLNYNTGWWRGLNPEGDHKKWGYILWDLDATFGYYINYTGVPNENPNAQPCDINAISDFMDSFFGPDGGGDLDPEDCLTITDGISPYPADDPIFALVINQDAWCCTNGWDNVCQEQYDALSNDGGAGVDPGQLSGNIGKHEKMLLKLQEESADFRQLYYSRMADLRNTVFTCDNMITTLDRMLAVIEPEMPKQIARWGGTMSGWEANVDQLKNFITQRCDLIDDGMIDCYDLTGPYNLTLMTEPIGIGEIDLNSLDVETFPWTGEYFGGMENRISANVWNENEDAWKFDHWETANGSQILSDITDIDARMILTQDDTLTAVFTLISATEEVDDLLTQINFEAYPNPAVDKVVLRYDLEESQNVRFELHSPVGQRLAIFDELSGRKHAGHHEENMTIDRNLVPSGMYFIKVFADDKEHSFKLTLID